MPSISFTREYDFRYGIIEQVAPDIRRLTARNPGPFTFYGTGTYIVGRGEVAVIDPGPNDSAHIEALLAGLSGEHISHILVTHCHRDHSPAAQPLQQATGAPTCGYGPHSGVEDNSDAPVEEGVDQKFIPDQRLRPGERIQGADWEIECVHTPGHTSNHLCFALPTRRVLFSGDHVMAWSTSVIIPPDGSMSDYLASLAQLLLRDDECYWPTHGPPLHDPHDHITALINHRHQRLDQILELLETGDWYIGDLVSRLYSDINPQLLGAAARSTLASLLHLQQAGEVESQGTVALDARYRSRSSTPNDATTAATTAAPGE